jgi:tetratricopeptide (TPR) repeat protein
VIAAAAVLASARPAAADEVGDLLKAGTDAYQNGQYDDAIAKLQKAYDLQPKPETLFALAQAERLGGHCPVAIKHYKQVLEKLTDLDTAKLVQGNVALCEKTEAVDTKTTPTPPPATTTIVRVESHTDYLAIASFSVGALSLGSSVGLYLASNATRDEAARAVTLDANHSLNDRADLERGMSYLTAGVGVGLVGFAIYRWISGGGERAPAVSLGHTATTTTLSFITAF